MYKPLLSPFTQWSPLPPAGLTCTPSHLAGTQRARASPGTTPTPRQRPGLRHALQGQNTPPGKRRPTPRQRPGSDQPQRRALGGSDSTVGEIEAYRAQAVPMRALVRLA